ncbi:tannase-domain-containing protein [Dendrothele bispora CBS 962.96]|uniref:Carboxylic ester hydrolase n=1 Tax=Dendrothele bispora (strain CBS 962.96) TaxID=1314807 RepID=A0A4S8LMV9_DENBC|nr:tannase-domain-containing protein [Dendrothele bispora CBS 962.96]
MNRRFQSLRRSFSGKKSRVPSPTASETETVVPTSNLDHDRSRIGPGTTAATECMLNVLRDVGEFPPLSIFGVSLVAKGLLGLLDQYQIYDANAEEYKRLTTNINRLGELFQPFLDKGEKPNLSEEVLKKLELLKLQINDTHEEIKAFESSSTSWWGRFEKFFLASKHAKELEDLARCFNDQLEQISFYVNIKTHEDVRGRGREKEEKERGNFGHSAGFDFDSTCTSVTTSQISSIAPNATVWFSELVPAGTNVTFPDNDPTCARSSQVVLTDTCRIAMFIPTSERSNISFEAWFPRNWTGRFLSTGNGGLSGCIQYEDMAYASALGFATVGANNGHNGTSGRPFLNNSEVVEDFALSYYLGCSSGDRQGLKSVQDFPENFDGVVAGAPAADFNHLLDWSGHFFGITGNSSASTFLPTDQWINLIHLDVLADPNLLITCFFTSGTVS